jgi:flagellar biosynthesis GTPase FlhF
VDLEAERSSKEKEDDGDKDAKKEDDEKEKDKDKEKDKEKDESASPSKKDPKEKKNKEVWQRVNNWKLAVRLNSEILSQQTKMKEMLQSNKYLIPEVTTQQKTDAFVLVEEYCIEAQRWLGKRVFPGMDDAAAREVLTAFLEASPIAQVLASDPELAISTQVGCRVLKLAALLDNDALVNMLEKHVHSVLEPTGVEPLTTWAKDLTKYVRGLIAAPER